MKAITDINELKKIELDILTSIDKYCRENNIKYFLAYGTLIGAIRHEGFIPWDDDVDIQMPREDYDKFIEGFNKKSNSFYKVISPFDKVAKHSFAKVIDTRTIKIEAGVNYKNEEYLGVDVDIFPIDGMPANEGQYNRWYKKLKRCYNKFYYCIAKPNSGSIKYRIFIFIMKFFFHNKNKYLIKAKKLHQKYKYEECEYVGTMESGFSSRKNKTQKDNFSQCIQWRFEGYYFLIPSGYDNVLRNIYGDYMELPPIEQQTTHHVNNVFWIA